MYAALQYAASFHCLVQEWNDCVELKPKPKEKMIFVDNKRKETKISVQEFRKMVKATYGRTRHGKKNGQAGRSLDLVQTMLGLCEAENGTQTDELLQARAGGPKRAWQNVETNSGSGRRKGPGQGSKELEDRRTKRPQEYRRLWNEFKNGRIHGAERAVERRQREDVAGRWCIAERKKETF